VGTRDAGAWEREKYIRQKKFSHLNDPVLEGYFKKIKRVEYAALAFAVAIVIITLADIA
jgi:hypothetical protein